MTANLTAVDNNKYIIYRNALEILTHNMGLHQKFSHFLQIADKNQPLVADEKRNMLTEVETKSKILTLFYKKS